MPFEWQAETLKRRELILNRYPENYKQSAVIPLLDLVQQQNNGYLSLNAMNAVADTLGPARIGTGIVFTCSGLVAEPKTGRRAVVGGARRLPDNDGD